MGRLWDSVTFRIALIYGALVIASLVAISSVFYYGAVEIQARSVDTRLITSSDSLAAEYRARGAVSLQLEIEQLLNDGVYQDTEIYQLLDPNGRVLAGNLADASIDGVPFDTLVTRQVVRNGHPSISRLLWHRLPDGAILTVGRDLHDKERIQALILRSLGVGVVVALLLAFGGAYFVRRQITRSIAAIRHTAREIQSGNLHRRIPVTPADDEFMRLGRDINHMLDRIEQLMDGVKHVSNTIAHNLRTPLGRTRAQLDEALRHYREPGPVSEAAAAAIQEIDALIVVFERLLQIAEAESGTRRRPFEAVPLDSVVTDVVELYDAMAESRGMSLMSEVNGEPTVLGDRHLLSAAVANLVENAIKYADGSSAIRVAVEEDPRQVSITVEDKGPGVPVEELGRVTERFYRLESRKPGSGLGLSIVTAIASLHQGRLQLEDAGPGLRARIVLPHNGTSLLAGDGLAG